MIKIEVKKCVVDGKEVNCDSLEKSKLKDIAELVGAYEVDGSHSSVGFAIRHIVTTTNGSILVDSGLVSLKDGNVEKMFFILDTKTINTQSEGRDKHLKSVDFFDAEKFPTITFEAFNVIKLSTDSMPGEYRYNGVGKLTIKGVTKDITVPFNYIGKQEQDWKEYGKFNIAGFEGRVVIKRSDFGIGEAGGALGDEVTINFTIEALQKIETKAEAKKDSIK